MKKILMVIAAVAVLQTVAYAQSIDFSGDVTGGKSVEVTNLENGYYDLTAVCKNASEEGVSYLYGVSDGYTAASTVLPVSADGVKVTVRGIEVENGKCTIGVGTDGNGVIEVSDVDLVKTDKQNGFIQGGDMTEVDYIESLGGEYKDSDGNKIDPFEFLSQNGMNMARIRLSNTPGKGTGDGVYYLPSGFQDEGDCLKLAKRAKDANSFSDYKQGSATAEYRHYVDEAVQLAERQKQRVDPMYHEKIDSLLDTYARKLAANMNKGYEIDARVPSILIAGGSNFPTRKKEKQNAARDSNYREWQDIQGLLDKIRSTGMGGISADDPQAVQKLEKKLESLEKSQETMKAVNAYYRKHKTLDGCPHLLPEQLEKLKADMASSWHLGDKPFATWALSNNSAEIRRVKDRIKSLSQQKEIGFVGWEFDGGKVEANTEANRLQIFFEDKPDEATREALKSNGFRWSPKAGVWQRQLTSNAYYAADYVKAIAPLTEEKPTELQRAHIRAQKVAAQEQFAQGQPEQEAPQDKDTFSIYQIKGGDETRDLRFEPYDRLIAAGHRVDAKNYTLVYSAPLTPGTSLEDIYTRFNIDHPKDFKGHSLSVSDVVVLHQNGQDTAHYVDSFGYKDVPEFLQPENYLKAAEQTTEQNYNMIDGQINNIPTATELEEKAKAGGQISLAEYAEALKAEKKQAEPEKKSSIRAQLKAAKEQAPKKQARQKTQDLERS